MNLLSKDNELDSIKNWIKDVFNTTKKSNQF